MRVVWFRWKLLCYIGIIEMARYKLPILFLNLSGEMIYILDQRLRAQQVSEEKTKKVLSDIISIMFNQRFLEELFKPQEVHNKEALRSVFSDLAHASIMRLNEDSMGKLYDLMRMVFKYQVFASTQPKDLILITLNHLDAIRALCCTQPLQKQVDNAYFLLIKTFGQMSSGELQRLRYHILNFFQDMRIRVSVFMRQKVQNDYGSFAISASSTVPHSCEVPGSVRVYDPRGHVVNLLTFDVGGQYVQQTVEGSTELRGARRTSLGTNIYSTSARVVSEPAGAGSGMDLSVRESMTEGTHYREELNLLVKQLTAGLYVHSSSDIVTLDLFHDLDQSTRNVASPQIHNVMRAKNEDIHNESLHKVLTEMADEDKSETPDSVSVVQLMDTLL